MAQEAREPAALTKRELMTELERIIEVGIVNAKRDTEVLRAVLALLATGTDFTDTEWANVKEFTRGWIRAQARSVDSDGLACDGP